jgi:hypothetical protein
VLPLLRLIGSVVISSQHSSYSYSYLSVSLTTSMRAGYFGNLCIKQHHGMMVKFISSQKIWRGAFGIRGPERPFGPRNSKSASEFSTTVLLILSQMYDTGTLHSLIISPGSYQCLSRPLSSAVNEFVNVKPISGVY